MSKKVLAACAAAVMAIVLAGVFLATSTENVAENTPSDSNSVSITMSSSRPGCETVDTCYLPPEITIDSGDSVTWINDDSAFHTVTSGHYDEHDGIFDSGQLDPAQKFSHTFSESGQFQYYCRLHPWMDGKIIVK